MDLDLVNVTGRILLRSSRTALTGKIIFEPYALWVITVDEQWIATRIKEVELSEEGDFSVDLLPTNMGAPNPWHYRVHAPHASWDIKVTAPGPHSFGDLVPRRFQ